MDKLLVIYLGCDKEFLISEGVFDNISRIGDRK